MAATTRMISKQLEALREEEAKDDAWFTLPLEPENIKEFTVEVAGPDMYSNIGDGKKASPYAEKIFRIKLSFPDDYPRSPPKFNFETRIWHPNIDAETGKPCVDLVTTNWKPTSTIGDILNLIRELMAAPNASDSVNAAAAGEMHDDIEKFHAHAKAEADAYATA